MSINSTPFTVGQRVYFWDSQEGYYSQGTITNHCYDDQTFSVALVQIRTRRQGKKPPRIVRIYREDWLFADRDDVVDRDRRPDVKLGNYR